MKSLWRYKKREKPSVEESSITEGADDNSLHTLPIKTRFKEWTWVMAAAVQPQRQMFGAK
jgi:hypothetical protein